MLLNCRRSNSLNAIVIVLIEFSCDRMAMMSNRLNARLIL
jgi:hypothetical protein